MARRSATASAGSHGSGGEPPEVFEENIVDIDVADEMRGSYLEYAYSVIYQRAIRMRGTASSRCSAGSSTR